MLKFFRLPFATTGDKTAVPDAVDSNGNVSYSQGYGFDYQRQKTDPAAKNIERDKMNQILFDITTAIAELQSKGGADFITSALNGGTAYSYGQNAIVNYGGAWYISLAAANTALPTDATKWALLPTTKGVQRFTSNGTFTVPAGVSTIYVSGCAGGGGGGGVAATTTGQNCAGGSGGGAGQSVIRQAFSVTPGQSIGITIGAGGTAGPAGNPAGAGGNTVIGSLLTLTGGSGGSSSTPISNKPSYGVAGGAGYPAGSYATDCGAPVGGNAGAGASSPFGGGAPATRNGMGTPFAGSSAGGFGAGGGGAGGVNGDSGGVAGAAGGAGTPGIVIIEW